MGGKPVEQDSTSLINSLILEGKVNQVQFQKGYGANNGTPINIDQINNPTGYIYKIQNGNTFSGTWPSKLNGDSCILAGYSYILPSNKVYFGVQLAFGIAGSDKTYIAMRSNAWTSESGKDWTTWKYIELTTT